MANVIGNGSISQIADVDGDPITTANRFPVETEQDDAFTSWTSYDDVVIGITGATLNAHLGLTGGNKISDAKEVIIQTDDGNGGFIMIGSSSSVDASGSPGANHGIKLNAGESIVLAVADFDTIHIDGSAANQYTNVAYFK